MLMNVRSVGIDAQLVNEHDDFTDAQLDENMRGDGNTHEVLSILEKGVQLLEVGVDELSTPG